MTSQPKWSVHAFAHKPRPSLQSIGARTGLLTSNLSKLRVTVAPALTWEEEYADKTLRDKIRLAPLALVRILTKPGRDALSWVNKELPVITLLWPKDNLRLRAYLVGSLVFMIMGKWVNVQVPSSCNQPSMQYHLLAKRNWWEMQVKTCRFPNSS